MNKAAEKGIALALAFGIVAGLVSTTSALMVFKKPSIIGEFERECFKDTKADMVATLAKGAPCLFWPGAKLGAYLAR